MNQPRKHTKIRQPIRPPAGSGPVLNRMLAEEYANRLATKDCAGDSQGPDFADFHQLLVTQVRGIDGRLNLLAWQIGINGDCARISPVGPAGRDDGPPGSGPSQDDMLDALIRLREAMILRLKSAIGLDADPRGDAGTSLLLADVLACHERDVWMLCALRWDRRAAAATAAGRPMMAGRSAATGPAPRPIATGPDPAPTDSPLIRDVMKCPASTVRLRIQHWVKRDRWRREQAARNAALTGENAGGHAVAS